MSEQPSTPRIKVVCPHCGAKASAPAEYAGRRVKCAAAGCGQSFELPKAAATGPQRAAKSLSDNAYLSTGEPFDSIPIRRPTGPAVASNPGQVPFNMLQYWRHQPLGIWLGGGATVVFLLLWLGLTLAGVKASIPTKDGGETPLWVFAPACLLTTIYFAWNEASKFRRGDANPGIVVALNPTLIAVPTDLTQGGDEFPAVKILKVNLTSSAGEPLQIGTVVPTVAIYSRAPHKGAGHWSDFHPQPAEYATSDKQVLQRLVASFPDRQFKFLQQALKLIERPFKPGLYALWSAPGKAPGRWIGSAKDF